MIIGVGSNHKGLKLKEETINYLEMWGFEVADFGTATEVECDYPKFAYLVAKAVASGKVSRGILLSETGFDMCIAANKINGVRAARCATWQEAQLCHENFGVNVLCLGEDTDLWGVIDSWLSAKFKLEINETHLDQISEIESVE